MYAEISLPEGRTGIEKSLLGTLLETAETARDNALNKARKKLRPRDQESDLASLFERRDFIDYFKYAMAHEIAQVIATYDQHVQAVYLFEESTNPDAETEEDLLFVDLTIHLLVLVASTSAALKAFVTSLDRTLTEALSELPSAAFSKRTSSLNVIPITQDDVKERRGYAILLSSIFAPPLKIWQR